MVGGTVYSLEPSGVEALNNALVAGVVAAFLGIISLGAVTADLAALISPENQHPELLPNAFPVLFLSMVYHNVVPHVVTQLEGDRDKITKSILMGTAVPLVMFLLWNAVVLGNVAAQSGGAGEFAVSGEFDPVALLREGGDGGGGERAVRP